MSLELQDPSVYTRTINGSEITFVCLDHEAQISSYPWSTIDDYLSRKAEKVVVEYFPPELDSTVNNKPFFGNEAITRAQKTGITPFFNSVADLVSGQRKNILVMDPANNITFQALYYEGPSFVRMIGASSLLFVSIFQPFFELSRLFRSHEDSLETKITRRQFLKALAFGASTYTIGSRMHDFDYQDNLKTKDRYDLYRDNSWHMRDMRWVTVASGLDQYTSENPGEQLAVIYPEAHITGGVLHYLDNPGDRRRKYSVYSKIPLVTKSIREYSKCSDIWVSQSSRPIIS